MNKELIVIPVMMMIVLMLGSMPVYAQPLNYCCPICGVCFSTEGELEDHFDTHGSESISLVWV